MINPLVLQKFIAERLGWTDVHESNDGTIIGELPHDKMEYAPVPIWPDDRNATKDLPVKDKDTFFKALKNLGSLDEVDKFLGGETDPVFDSAYRECIAWIFAEHGYRWVECVTCKGKGGPKTGYFYPDGEPIFAEKDCTDCHGEKGEFVKIEKEPSGGKQKTDHS